MKKKKTNQADENMRIWAFFTKLSGLFQIAFLNSFIF